MTSGNEKNTASSINERIKDIIRFSYTKDELFQALLYSDLLEKVLSPIDVQALEDRFTQIKIADAYSDYRNGKTNIVDMNKDSALKLLDRFGDGMTGPDDEGLFLIDEEDGMFTAIDNTTAGPKTFQAEHSPSRTFQASSSIFSMTISRGILSNLQHRKTLLRMTIAQPSICPEKPLPRVRHRLGCLMRSARSPTHAMKAPSATADQRTEV